MEYLASPWWRHLATRWEQGGIPGARERFSRAETLLRFGERVREATPPVRGFFDTTARPEYGILVPPTLGHAFVYYARRPVVINNLGPYLDPEKLRNLPYLGHGDKLAGGAGTKFHFQKSFPRMFSAPNKHT